MSTFGKVIINFVFTALLFILILLGTLRFQILDKSFLFGAFEKNNVYAQLPTLLSDYISNGINFSEQQKFGYADFAKAIPVKIVKPIVENNLTQVLDYLNGQSKNLTISLSIPGVGFEGSSGFNWSPSQIPNQSLQEKIKLLNGITGTLIVAGIIILIILIGLFLFYGALSCPVHLLDGKTLLLSSGVFISAISLILKIFFAVIGRELLAGQELSQKILGLLSTSLLPGITTTWFVIGGSLIALWLVLLFVPKYEKLLE